MYFRYIKVKLHEIKKWRWFLLVLFFTMVAYFDVVNYTNIEKLSFSQLLILELNDYFNICYYFLFAIIIISSDIFSGSKEMFYNQVFIKLGTRKKYFLSSFIYIVFLSIIILFIFVIVTLIVYVIINGGFYSTHQVSLEMFGLPGLTISNGLILSFSLLVCRFIFLNTGIFIINFKLNYPVGFLFAFTISIIDYWFYEIFQIMEPLFILPIEHTRIFYTEAVAPAIQYSHRISYNISYVYWFGLIIIELLILWKIISKKDFVTLEYIN